MKNPIILSRPQDFNVELALQVRDMIKLDTHDQRNGRYCVIGWAAWLSTSRCPEPIEAGRQALGLTTDEVLTVWNTTKNRRARKLLDHMISQAVGHQADAMLQDRNPQYV